MFLTNRKILIAEDEEGLLEVYRLALSDKRFDLTLTQDGSEAKVMMEKEKFDLIITDLNMPNMTGQELIASIKISELNYKTPIMVISGQLEGALSKLDELGAIERLPKPVNPEYLKQLVTERFFPEILEVVDYHPDIVEVASEATQEVLEFYFGTSYIEIGKLSIADQKQSPAFTSATIGFWGKQLFGSFTLSCNEAFVAKLAHHLLGLDEEDSITNVEKFTDLAGEMANQIAGLFKRRLKERGFSCVIGLPMLVVGYGHKAPAMYSGPSVRAEVKVDNTSCWISFTLGDPKELENESDEPKANVYVYGKAS